MTPIFDNLGNYLSGTSNTTPFSLSGMGDFPFQEYSRNRDRYLESLSWYDGTALDPSPEEIANKMPDLYPVKINPIKSTVLKHAYALFGEVDNDGRPLVLPRFVMGDPDSQRGLVKVGEDALNTIWWESFGRAIQMQNAIVSQIYGGCVFRLRHVPWQKYRTIPIAIEKIMPEQFVGIPEYGDEFRLREAWIARPILPKHALQYGVEVSESEPAYWIEHWTTTEYTVTINGKPISHTIDGVKYSGYGKNEYGFVPVVYIPHIRDNGFYGTNVIDNLRGIVKEINLRLGDYGDAVNVDSHNVIAGRNLQGNPRIIRVGDVVSILDIGSANGFTGNEPDPELFEVRKSQSASAPMKDLIDVLFDMYRRNADMPKVADGEDEGSQRSAATLVTRMWPLVSHVKTERYFWGSGLDWLSVMALGMMKFHGYGDIEDAHLKLRIRQNWAPVLPKDRESFITEVVNRASNNLGSPEHLLEMLGDVEDVTEEIERIKDWISYLEDVKAESAAKFALTPTVGVNGDDDSAMQKRDSVADKKEEPDKKPPTIKETRGNVKEDQPNGRD